MTEIMKDERLERQNTQRLKDRKDRKIEIYKDKNMKGQRKGNRDDTTSFLDN
jgi:hypothetical protein